MVESWTHYTRAWIALLILICLHSSHSFKIPLRYQSSEPAESSTTATKDPLLVTNSTEDVNKLDTRNASLVGEATEVQAGGQNASHELNETEAPVWLASEPKVTNLSIAQDSNHGNNNEDMNQQQTKSPSSPDDEVDTNNDDLITADEVNDEQEDEVEQITKPKTKLRNKRVKRKIGRNVVWQGEDYTDDEMEEFTNEYQTEPTKSIRNKKSNIEKSTRKRSVQNGPNKSRPQQKQRRQTKSKTKLPVNRRRKREITTTTEEPSDYEYEDDNYEDDINYDDAPEVGKSKKSNTVREKKTAKQAKQNVRNGNRRTSNYADNSGHMDEDYEYEYDDDGDDEDDADSYEYIDEIDDATRALSARKRKSKFATGNELRDDVTTPAANGRTKKSDKRVKSNDVMPVSTNSRGELEQSDGDVRKYKKGVGGKSMNEMLNEVFSDSTPPNIFPIGECHLENLSVMMQCGGNMFSVCAASPSYSKIKVLIEGGNGGDLLTQDHAVVYGILPYIVPKKPLEATGDWELTAAPDVRKMSHSCRACGNSVPVLRFESGDAACRYSINCTYGAQEAWTRLPAATAAFSACSPAPALYAKMALAAGDGSDVAPWTKVTLGDRVSLRVEAEADVTGTTLTIPTRQTRGLVDGDASANSDLKPIIDLHLQKCWVGNAKEQKADLLLNGCSTVDVLQKFAEHIEEGSKFLVFGNNNGSSHAASIHQSVKQSTHKLKKENDRVKEKYQNARGTKGNRRIHTDKVVQNASLIVFVLSLEEKAVEITCDIKVCLGECLESPACVASTVNLDRGQRVGALAYSILHTLTLTYSPNTDPTVGDKDAPVTERNPEASPTTSAMSSEDTEVQRGERYSRSVLEEKTNISGSAEEREASTKVLSNGTQENVAHNVSGHNQLDDRKIKLGTSPKFPECVPWWLFFLCITILTLVYIIALVGCMYLTTNSPHGTSLSHSQMPITPVKPYYCDDSSARKRSPASTERYMY